MPAENKQEADKSLKPRRMAVGNGESNSISGKKRRKKKKDADSEIAGFGGAKITGGSVKDEKSTTERNKQCIRTGKYEYIAAPKDFLATVVLAEVCILSHSDVYISSKFYMISL